MGSINYLWFIELIWVNDKSTHYNFQSAKKRHRNTNSVRTFSYKLSDCNKWVCVHVRKRIYSFSSEYAAPKTHKTVHSSAFTSISVLYVDLIYCVRHLQITFISFRIYLMSCSMSKCSNSKWNASISLEISQLYVHIVSQLFTLISLFILRFYCHPWFICHRTKNNLSHRLWFFAHELCLSGNGFVYMNAHFELYDARIECVCFIKYF